MESIRRYFYNLMTDKNKGIIPCPLKSILFILSLVFGAILWMRNFSYKAGLVRPKSFPGIKVISVGNLTLGGTGKTPMVIKIASILREKDKRVSVLLRGYGKDEYLLLEKTLERVPVIKGKNRIKSARLAINKYKPDTLLLDDGFQYRKLKKDLNILLLDSRNPFGNGKLIPRGILREGLSSIKMADMVILTKTSDEASNSALKDMIKGIRDDIQIFEAYHKPVLLYDILDNKEYPADVLKKRSIASLSSIGDPDYFNDMLAKAGGNIILKFQFLDHHNYTKREISKILSASKEKGAEYIVTTEKDAVKIKALIKDSIVKVLCLKIRMEFRKDEDNFYSRLFGIYVL